MKDIKSVNIPVNKGLFTFGVGTLLAFLALLPYIVYDRGLFLYYGDFNVQQIPFYQLAHEAVRTGNVFWNWGTDLGANFLGSYSFYLLFSPFFWLTLPFPTTFVPYLMGPLIALKTGCCAFTAYLFLKRFVKDIDYAIIGGLLYAFSGFAMYNIFFNHFHEAMIVFPLLLIGLEKSMIDEKWGWFALAITINAIINYWFFIGAVVFVILYFMVRFIDDDWVLTKKKFLFLAVEAVVGLLMAAVVLLPSVLAIADNPRTGGTNILLGNNLWYYSNPQRYLGIIHSILFSPDMPALNNWFPDHGGQWSSISAYIPLFSVSMVLAWMYSQKQNWIKRILIVSFVMAMVPMLNHSFVLFNNSYYARWFYMPILMMSLATVLALENSYKGGSVDPWKGLSITGLGIVIIAGISGLTPFVEDGEIVYGNYNYLDKFLATLAITVLGFSAVTVLMYFRDHPKFKERLINLTFLGCFVYMFSTLLIGKMTYHDNSWITETAMPARDNMSMSAEGVFERSDVYEGNDNIGMYWNIPNIQAFHSVVPASIMEFYPSVGVKRDVSSKPEITYDELRSMLSVRWLYYNEEEDTKYVPDDYLLVDNKYGYDIYENLNYIPMGFVYQNYVTQEQLDEVSNTKHGRVYISAIYLDEDGIGRNDDILIPITEDLTDRWYQYSYYDDVVARNEKVCDSFTVTKTGFVATSSFNSDELVFFSVPYDKGWSAQINGEDVLIEKANVGFMAVRVPGGDSEIVFTFTPSGIEAGAVITVVAVLLFAGYLKFLVPIVSKKEEMCLLNTEQVGEEVNIESTNEKDSELGFETECDENV